MCITLQLGACLEIKPHPEQISPDHDGTCYERLGFDCQEEDKFEGGAIVSPQFKGSLGNEYMDDQEREVDEADNRQER